MKKTHPFSGMIIRYLTNNNEKNKEQTNQINLIKNENTLFNNTYLDDEIHIDLYEMENSKPFLDIGIMIGNRENVAAVVVDLPWESTLKDISDLGFMLNGEKSVSIIFNEVIHYDGFSEGDFANISFHRNGVDVNPFSLLRLPPQSFETKTIFLNGRGSYTRLTITVPFSFYHLNDERFRQSVYIRFRIKNIPTSVYSYFIIQKERELITSYSETSVYYFQINTLQKIPYELLSKESGLYFPPKLGLIKFNIITTKNNERNSMSNDFHCYSPIINERAVSDYIQREDMVDTRKINSIKNYFRYQWIIKKEDENFVKELEVLGRFNHKKTNYVLFIRLILFFIISSALGNGLWEMAVEIANSPPNIFDIIKSKSEQLTIFFILEIFIYIDIILKRIPYILSNIKFII